MSVIIKPMSKRVCVIIPAYNESSVIEKVVHGIVATMKKSSYRFEVVVVDDGSRDKTAEQARKGGATVIQHIINSGAGAATATGLGYANQEGFDIAVTMDADGQHLPQDVLNGVKTIDKTDVDLLIGSRLIDSQGMSRVKVLGNRGLSLITFVLFGIRVTDSQSGLRVFSHHSLENLRWKTSGYEFCSEMLWRANQLRLIVKEYPIKAVYTEYSKGKGQNNWNAINIVKNLLKHRLMELFG